MPFDPNSAKIAGKKSKRGPAKKKRAFHQGKNGNALWKSTGWSAGKPRKTHQDRTGKSICNPFKL